VREPKGNHPPPTVAAALKQAGIHQVHGWCRHLFYLMKLIEITEGGKEPPLFPYNNNTQQYDEGLSLWNSVFFAQGDPSPNQHAH
jgi:hypothetical protein